MISQICEEINVNTNGHTEIRIEKCLSVEFRDGWEKWSLEDVYRTIKVMDIRYSD